jgi:hypothetical protein
VVVISKSMIREKPKRWRMGLNGNEDVREGVNA